MKTRARGRPRDAEIDRKVLDAARELLAKEGYRGLAFDTLSQITNIPRSMIYRRWPTRVHLANEISTGGGGELPDIIDREGLEAQILELVRQILGRYSRADIGSATVGLIADTLGNPELQTELQAETEAHARAGLASITARGKAAGLIADDIESDTLFDMLVGTLIYRALFSLEPVPSSYPESVTRIIVDGLTRR
ncbi:MAG: TetR/AcrR family transcriptional regulator C-terminal ligand-binding domain-containing protein [Sphingomonas taxi]